eukprot:TRINITY_DN9114_c0_g1_i1.p1 TRINITY_DN9114_c0_g1~~TRINITY_DN9114_c0_g1_i1.p1  ORF type:complete len:104 (+),score=9.47 TRINITY_DN9114_c0_g1_i1:40-312(+)
MCIRDRSYSPFSSPLDITLSLVLISSANLVILVFLVILVTRVILVIFIIRWFNNRKFLELSRILHTSHICNSTFGTVSYTHLTLPTIYSV